MSDMLSQEEIDALLNGADAESNETDDAELTSQEMDALGEVGNICMGTSATTLFTLLGQKVIITTPNVSVIKWEDFYQNYDSNYVGVKVEYKMGLQGFNFLVMKEDDVKIITDLMMGGEGVVTEGEITDLNLSAISEAMNQMVGSSATSMSSMFDKRIDISPPSAFMLNLDEHSEGHMDKLKDDGKIVKISFKMEVGEMIDSEIIQFLPIDFAKELVKNLLDAGDETGTTANVEQSSVKQEQQREKSTEHMMDDIGSGDEMIMSSEKDSKKNQNVSVQPAQFQSFDEGKIVIEKKNINMIMDVPLQVTVELGRTHKVIKDILELGPGSIIELDKLAGEPVDILVNGKIIAKGEVVVIDESFGVRITDIINASKRI